MGVNNYIPTQCITWPFTFHTTPRLLSYIHSNIDTQPTQCITWPSTFHTTPRPLSYIHSNIDTQVITRVCIHVPCITQCRDDGGWRWQGKGHIYCTIVYITYFPYEFWQIITILLLYLQGVVVSLLNLHFFAVLNDAYVKFVWTIYEMKMCTTFPL